MLVSLELHALQVNEWTHSEAAELHLLGIPQVAQHDSMMQVHCAQVRECLLALPQKKWVFTNCNEKHAKLALETLQLQVILSPIHPPGGYDSMNALACNRNSKTCSPVL